MTFFIYLVACAWTGLVIGTALGSPSNYEIERACAKHGHVISVDRPVVFGRTNVVCADGKVIHP